VISAVIFDLDGVLVDSEQQWDEARQGLAAEHGRPWPPEATTAMQGMSAPEWSRYLAEAVGIPMAPAAINAAVVARMQRAYEEELPALPGAAAAVERLASHWPLGLASSSNRELIDLALELMGVTARFGATVSSEEVPRGKPAPDVYLEAARQLGVDPREAAAVEDSSNGIRSAKAAGMTVIAIPNPHYPPAEDALAAADSTLDGVDALTVEAVRRSAAASSAGTGREK
jgi:HAD superfamily hydrolase (TIGR01509 family)